MDKHDIAIANIQERIFTIRGQQVMLDRDLAEMYHVEVKRLNEQVKRNIERFPESFRFHWMTAKGTNWSQIATGSNRLNIHPKTLMHSRNKDYSVQGYAINERRLQQKELEVRYLKKPIHHCKICQVFSANNLTFENYLYLALGRIRLAF